MKALLLAAGLGTRLLPITKTIPKCLVPIQGKPLLEYWLDLLLTSGISRVIINTHYFSEQVENFINNSLWKEYVTLVHEKELLGTGGTILKNGELLNNDSFLLAHADNLTRFDIKEFIQRHRNRPQNVDLTMMTFDTDTPQSCGIVEVNNENIVLKFHEKSPENHGTLANAAVYIIEPNVIDFLQLLNKEVIDFSTEVIPNFLGRIQIYHNANYHRDIGTPESLQKAECEF